MLSEEADLLSHRYDLLHQFSAKNKNFLVDSHKDFISDPDYSLASDLLELRDYDGSLVSEDAGLNNKFVDLCVCAIEQFTGC